MNFKFVLPLILLASLALAAGSYSVVVAENGRALVTAQLTGSGNINVPIPLDATDKVVSGAPYIDTPNGISIDLKSGTPATLVFTSNLLVAGSKFGIELPAGVDTLTVSFPAGTVVASTNPSGQISQSSSGVTAIWNSPGTSVSATLSSAPRSSIGYDYTWVAVILVIIVVVVFYLMKVKKNQ